VVRADRLERKAIEALMEYQDWLVNQVPAVLLE